MSTQATTATQPASARIPKSDAVALEYMRDTQRALLAQEHHTPLFTLLLIIACVGGTLLWAGMTTVEETTRGNAKVIPSSREQVIQSLEGGILAELLVKEGQIVEAGQGIAKIDPTKAQTSLQEGRSKAVALRATAARLRAEARNTELVFPPEVMRMPEILRNETNTYNTKKLAVDQGIATLAASKKLVSREIALTEPMVTKGLVAEVELLRLQRQLNELQMQSEERMNKYRAEAANELVKVESELAQASEIVTARADQMRRTLITAPVRGTVKNIRVNTIGGVIQPAQDIMEIVPLEDQLLVEAKIRPHDVAFLRPGLPATVKITAYDFSIYGGLEGVVDLLSPEEMYYRLLVRTNSSTLRSGTRELPIIPGMTATVEIRTGEKSVLDYLLKPVLKVREALHER
jgi:membrane fusion protein, adhesin transport system